MKTFLELHAGMVHGRWYPEGDGISWMRVGQERQGWQVVALGYSRKKGISLLCCLTARWVSNLGLVGWNREYLIGRFNFKLTHALAGSARENPCLNLKGKGSVAWNDVRRQEPFEGTNGTGRKSLSRFTVLHFSNPIPQTLGNCYSSVDPI